MKKHIICIASEFKGNDFLEECREAGWRVTLITKEKLLDQAWAWSSLSAVKTVPNDAAAEDYVRAVTNAFGAARADNIVGLDEFDVLPAARAREHLQLDTGMTISYALRFRDKLKMRRIAAAAGIACPEFTGVFTESDVNAFLENVPAPWIVKPRTEVNAFGIRKCVLPEQVWEVLSALDARNTWRDHPSQFLIEKFIEGSVFHVDSVVDKGKVVAAGFSRYGKPPMAVSHEGGVFTTSVLPDKSKERKVLEKLNKKLVKAFDYRRGVTHAEFLQSADTGEFYLLEVAARVGGAYIADVLQYAAGFNLWREWARLETSVGTKDYAPPKLKNDYAGIALALSKEDAPDTSGYADEEIVYRVKKPKHVGLIFHSPKYERVSELLEIYSERITRDFLAVAPSREHYDD